MNTTTSYWQNLKTIKASTTWLQGVGAHYGKPAGEIVAGDVLMWNYGYTSNVKSVREVSAKFVELTTSTADGQTHNRRMKKDRIVAIAGMGIANVTQDELALVGRLSK